MNEVNKITSQIEDRVSKVKEEDFPFVIKEQVGKIAELKKKIEVVMSQAKNLKKFADDLRIGKKEFKKPKSWFRDQKKDVIENMLSVQKQSGDTINMLADTQKELFEYQQKLAEATRFLFVLGASSLAANRRVIEQIKLEMQNATDEEMATYAEEEITKVLDELKQQQDILIKQEELQEKAKLNHYGIEILNNESIKIKEKLSSIYDSLSEKDMIDAVQSQKLEELRALLNNKDLVDQKQEQAISENTEAIKLIYDYIKQKDELDQKQSAEIENIALNGNGRKISIVAIVISSIALVGVIFDLLLNLF